MANLSQAYQHLPARDRLALGVLAGFLLIFGLGVGGWTLHQKATTAKKDYDKAVSEFFWLRSQAGNIATTPVQALPLSDAVKQTMAQAGITAQVVESANNNLNVATTSTASNSNNVSNPPSHTNNTNKIQLSFSHPQVSVINNVLNQLSQQGFTIEQLQITQTTPDATGKLDVQMLISKA